MCNGLRQVCVIGTRYYRFVIDQPIDEVLQDSSAVPLIPLAEVMWDWGKFGCNGDALANAFQYDITDSLSVALATNHGNSAWE
jgi:hypothetical protein